MSEITEEMVEAAARALCRNGASFPTPEQTLDWVDRKWRRFKDEAALALTAALQAAEAKPFAWHWTDKTGCLFITGDGRRDDIPPEAQPLYERAPTPSHSLEEARRLAIDEAIALIENGDWPRIVWEETTSDVLENVVSALRALSIARGGE